MKNKNVKIISHVSLDDIKNAYAKKVLIPFVDKNKKNTAAIEIIDIKFEDGSHHKLNINGILRETAVFAGFQQKGNGDGEYVNVRRSLRNALGCSRFYSEKIAIKEGTIQKTNIRVFLYYDTNKKQGTMSF